jgi:hypothetical protein
MTTNQTLSPELRPEWIRSTAHTPAAIPPHPALQSGGWYRGSPSEASGPGRYPLAEPAPKSVGLAVVLSVLLGPVGLSYVSATAGLVATTLAATTLLIVGAGLVPLLVIWPLSIIGSVWGAGHVRVSG